MCHTCEHEPQVIAILRCKKCGVSLGPDCKPILTEGMRVFSVVHVADYGIDIGTMLDDVHHDLFIDLQDAKDRFVELISYPDEESFIEENLETMLKIDEYDGNSTLVSDESDRFVAIVPTEVR